VSTPDLNSVLIRIVPTTAGSDAATSAPLVIPVASSVGSFSVSRATGIWVSGNKGTENRPKGPARLGVRFSVVDFGVDQWAWCSFSAGWERSLAMVVRYQPGR
jgi:hypothetical protein